MLLVPEPLIRRLNVVPLSNRRLPPLRLSVDPPWAEALPDGETETPLSVFPAAPVVSRTTPVVVLTVLPTVFPTALVVLPARLPAVFVTPPTVLPTPPSRPPPPLLDAEALVLERALDEELTIVSPNRSSFEAAARVDACVIDTMLPVIGMFVDPFCK